MHISFAFSRISYAYKFCFSRINYIYNFLLTKLYIYKFCFGNINYIYNFLIKNYNYKFCFPFRFFVVCNVQLLLVFLTGVYDNVSHTLAARCACLPTGYVQRDTHVGPQMAGKVTPSAGLPVAGRNSFARDARVLIGASPVGTPRASLPR
jgi:hypothetical protein